MSAEKRPKRPSADKTRAKILAAAKNVFLKYGFEASYIKMIAAEAKVNTNLIFHHFNDKEQLWQQVKQSIISECYLTHQYDLSSAKNFIDSLLEYRFKLYGEYPELVRLLQWQELTDKESELIGDDVNSPHRWINVIKRFQKTDEITDKIDAKQILLFIIFSTHAPFWQNVYPLTAQQTKTYQDMIARMCYDNFLIKE